MFDGDAAGIEAARRAIFVLAPYNFNIRVLTIPGGDDPDDFVKSKGGPAFSLLLETSSVDYMRYIIEKTAINRRRHSLRKIGHAAALRPCSIASDPVVQREFIKQLAERLSLSEDLVHRQVRQGSGAATAGYAPSRPDEAAAYFGSIEGNFIRLLLSAPSLIAEARRFITPVTFTYQFTGELYLHLLASFDDKGSLDSLLSRAADNEKRIITFAFRNETPVADANEELVQPMERLQEEHRKRKIPVPRSGSRPNPARDLRF